MFKLWARLKCKARSARRGAVPYYGLEQLEPRVMLSAGDLDSTFSEDGKLRTAIGPSNDFANSMVLQADGKILVVGTSYSNGSDDIVFALARYNVNGSLDNTFDADGKLTTSFGSTYAAAYSVAIQSDGKIVVAGQSSKGGNLVLALARYNVDGSLDSSFDTDGRLLTAIGSSYDPALGVAIQSDGKIIVAGTSGDGDNAEFALARFSVDGSPDTTFDGDGKLTTSIGNYGDYAHSVVLQANGKIVVAGDSNNHGNFVFALARYSADGSLDTTFDGDGKLTTAIGAIDDLAYSVAIQSDAKIVVAGYSRGGRSTNFALARYNTDGSLDTTFSRDGKLTTAFGSSYAVGASVAIQSDGKIIFAGTSSKGDNGNFTLARYHVDGSLDPTFDGDGKLTTGIGDASSVAIQSDGKILVAGSSEFFINADFTLARYQGSPPVPTVIHGIKFNDLDGDGVRDEGEPEIGHFEFLFDADPDDENQSAQRISKGNFTASSFAPDTYRVLESVPSGWACTTTNPLFVRAGSERIIGGLEFGNFSLILISGLKFNDTNGNGLQEESEKGLKNVTMFLDADNDGELDASEVSTQTNSRGEFAFKKLGPGTYRVREETPAGFTQTTPNPADVLALSGQNVSGLLFGNRQTEYPDLVAEFTAASIPPNFGPNAGGTATVKSTNNGTFIANGKIKVTLVLSGNTIFGDSDDVLLGTKSLSINLAPGGSEETVFSFKPKSALAAGDYFLLAKADSDDGIAELAENNNVGQSGPHGVA